MEMSRGLRPISFWVNETEKLWAQLGCGWWQRNSGRHSFVHFFLILCLTLPLFAVIFWLKLQCPLPATVYPPTLPMLSYLYVCAHMVPSVMRALIPVRSVTSF